MLPEDRGKQCLVLDLDETLVHSSFKVFFFLTFSLSFFSFFIPLPFFSPFPSLPPPSLSFPHLSPFPQPIANADFIIPVEIEDQVHQVYVLKRPGVDHFMKGF